MKGFFNNVNILGGHLCVGLRLSVVLADRFPHAHVVHGEKNRSQGHRQEICQHSEHPNHLAHSFLFVHFTNRSARWLLGRAVILSLPAHWHRATFSRLTPPNFQQKCNSRGITRPKYSRVGACGASGFLPRSPMRGLADRDAPALNRSTGYKYTYVTDLRTLRHLIPNRRCAAPV